MKFTQIPNVDVQTEYFAFQGGLDIETPALRVPAGSLLSCLNYEPDALGGYRRTKGYERFDGRTRPSDSTYQLIATGPVTAPPAAGGLLTIGDITAVFVREIPGGILVANPTGPTPALTAVQKAGGITIATTLAEPNLGSGITGEQDAQYLVDAAEVFRTQITAVPGMGPIRGVYLYNNVVYAFRDNVGQTQGQMYASSNTGWELVNLGESISFTNANASVGEGDTLTQGGASAIIRRVVLETGVLGTNPNAGRLILADRSGSFSAGAATSTGGGTLTLGGAQMTQTLPPGGRYEFDTFAFTNKLDSQRLYGANGVGPAFEFDGTTFVSLDTKGVPNTPTFIRAHRNYLFLSQGSSVIVSSLGNPYRYVAAEGAAEIGVGDVVTGMSLLPGEALGIFSQNRSQALVGPNPTTASLQTIRGDIGAFGYTVQTMSETFMFDDRGIIAVSSAQEYGNFADATLSRKIQRLVNRLRPNVIASHVNRERSHYKVLMLDGQTLTMCFSNKQLIGFGNGMLGFLPTCASTAEDDSGAERIFYGSTDGFVYEMERGSTFDGEDIEAFIKLFYVSSSSPEVRKRYRRMTMEMSAENYAQLRFQSEFSFGSPEIQVHTSAMSEGITVVGASGSGEWDVATWDEFFWDSQDILRPSLSVSGTGTNIALSFYSKTKLDFGHVLSGAILHYTPRRLQRT